MTADSTNSDGARRGRGAWLARLVPAVYLELEGGRRSLARVYGVALLIRVVLMPIACHADLLSTYHRSYLLLDHFVPRWWVPHELIQAALLAVYSSFLPLEELLGWEGKSTVSNAFWLRSFSPHPLAFLALFLFKLPYLVADLFVSRTLLRLHVDSPAKGLRAISMWLFNPITLFSFYVFARHDAIAIAFIAASMLELQRGRAFRGALALGVATWSRYYILILLPFFAIALRGDWKRRALLAGASLLPLAIYNVVTVLGLGDFRPPSLENISRTGYADYLLGMKFLMGSNQVLYVFPALYVLLFMFAAAAPDRRPLYIRFSRYALCTLLLMYGVAFFHPHYMSWMVFFLVLVRLEERRPVLGYLHVLQILAFVPYTFQWGEPLFGWLLTPLNPAFFGSLQSPWTFIEGFADPVFVMNLCRTALSAVSLFMAGWILFRPGSRASEAALPAAAGAAR